MSDFDVIALGDELATLLAAGLMAQRGARVVLVCPKPARTGREDDGAKLPPFVAPQLFAHATAATVTRVLRELQLESSVAQLLAPLGLTPQAAPQVLLPDARIALAGPEGLRAELQRELEGQPQLSSAHVVVDELCALSHTLGELLARDLSFPADSFWSRRRESRSAAELPSGRLASLSEDGERAGRALITAPAWMCSELQPDDPSALCVARALDGWLAGLHSVIGGRGRLTRVLMERLLALGVQTRPWPGVLRLHGGLLSARSVELDNGAHLRGDAILVGATLQRLLGWTDSPPRRLRQLAREVVPAGYRYLLHAVFHEQGLPQGLGPCAVARFSNDLPPTADNMLGLQVAPPTADGLVAVTATAIVAAEADGSIPDLSGTRPLIWSRLTELLPFSERHLVFADSPHDAATPPLGRGGNVDTAAYGNKLSPVAPTAVWKTSVDHSLDIAASPLRVGWNNVIVASRQNVPGLGLEGELITAWSAAKLTTELLSSTLTKRARQQPPAG